MTVSIYAIPGIKMIDAVLDEKHPAIIDMLNYSGVTFERLIGRKRKRPVVNYRQATIFILHSCCEFGASEIARLFDVNHATVLHSSIVIADQVNLYVNINKNVSFVSDYMHILSKWGALDVYQKVMNHYKTRR